MENLNSNKIDKILQDHERRLTALEGKKRKQKEMGGKKSLSDRIILLREQGFFKEARIPEDVYKKINASYPCDFSRVKVELIRLREKGYLRKTSKLIGKKKYIAYAW